MENGLKIVTIGGGSSYTPELIQGLIMRQHELPIRELWLVDVETGEEKQTIIVELAKRMLAKAGLTWQVYGTLHRREALKDADFVMAQFRVGQLDARVLDEVIPLSHGVIGQETNGAGGIFKAFRTIHAFKEIVADMRDLCPDAWLINFTNPAGIVTEALINKLGWTKTIGVCNIPIAQQKQAAAALQAAENELFIQHVGLNHYHFHKVWDQKGNERTTELIESYYGCSHHRQTVKNIADKDYNVAQLTLRQVLPCDYHRYYYLTDEMLADLMATYQRGETRAQQVKSVEAKLFDLYRNPNLAEKPKELEERGGAYYSDVACELISAIYHNKQCLMVVSTTNRGSIPFLEWNDVGEMTCVITSQGPVPLATFALSNEIQGELSLMKAMEHQTIQAALNGDYQAALQAFMLNPLIPNGTLAMRLLDELLIAHEPYLPQFQAAIHYIKEHQPECVARVANQKHRVKERIPMIKFPKGFLWGSSTSGPQSEGRIAGDGKSDNNWDYWFKIAPDKFHNGIGPTQTSTFYTHYKADIELLTQTGHNAFRTSIQWSRLIPTGVGEVNQQAVDFYRDVFVRIRDKGIKLIVNLYHFDLPFCLEEKGGWENKETVYAYEAYATKCFELFGDLVDTWITFNEPIVPVECGYLYQYHYPCKVDAKAAVQVAYNTQLASALAVRSCHRLNRTHRISIVLNLTPAYPRSEHPADVKAARIAELFQAKSFLDPSVKGVYPSELIELVKQHNLMPEYTAEELTIIKQNTVDFLGVNYYQPLRVSAPKYAYNTAAPFFPEYYYDHYVMPGRKMNPHRGWEIYEKGIYDIAMNIKCHYGNIEWILTENGMGVEGEEKYQQDGVIQDDYRIEFFKGHLKELHRAIAEGANCKGYLVWTFIDCWSWLNSYKNRYGLVALDLATQRRTIKKSGYWFKQLHDNNGFDV